MNGRARRFILNHMGDEDVNAVVSSVIGALKERHFEKSVPLEVIPGHWGDVYRRVPWAGEEWYVKVCVRDGRLSLAVLSANWEGYMH